MATAGSSVSNHLTLTENQKRWLVTGIAMNKVLVSQIRHHLEQEIQVQYNNLTTSHSIHTQSSSGRLERWPLCTGKVLKYENINGNDAHPKLPGRRNDYSRFDCQVTSHVEFAKLYVENYMAKFTAFDEHCDASAVLLLLGSVPVFPAAVQVAAFHVRKTRNAWAHCTFSDWDAAMFQQSFDNMENLVRALGLSTAEKDKIVTELRDWKKKGTDLCMNSPVDPALLQLIQQEVRGLQGTVDHMGFEVEVEKTRVQSEIQSIISVLEEISRWMGNMEERVCSLEVAVRSEKMKHSGESHIFPEIAICEGDIRFYASFFDESTRGWLIDDFQAWFSDPGHSRAYVLLGDPGIGKSVVAAVLCQRMRGQLAAAFFCRHNDSTRRNPRYLIGTIAHQLCECNSEYRNRIGGLSTIHRILQLDSLGVKELFTKLLEEPLNSCAPSSERMLVVIDALDESEYDGHSALLDLINTSFSRLPLWLVFFVTSRPEETIQYQLQDFNPCVRICSGDSMHKNYFQQHLNDIRSYITNEVGTFCVICEPNVVEGLLQKCEGMFLYAHHIIQQIKTHNIEPRKAVALYPNGIRQFYRKNFERIHCVLGQELFQILIGCSLVAPSPLPVSIIPYLLEKVSTETQLSKQRVLDAISTFFPLRDTGHTFTFLHNLIPRWLTDRKEAREYYIDRKSCIHRLVQILVEILKGVSETTLSENEDNDSFLAYCLRHGIRYICEFSFQENEYRQAFNCLTSVYFIQAKVSQGALMCYSLLNDYRLLREHEAANDFDRKELENFLCVLENNVHVLAQFPWLFLQCLKGNFSERRFSQFNQQLPFCDTLTPVLVLPGCFHSNAAAFALSPDRKLIAVVKRSEFLFHLYLMNSTTFEAFAPPVRLPVTKIHDLKFSPNGQYIFFGSLLEWCSVDGTLVKFDQFEGHNCSYENSSFICDGKYLLVRLVSSVNKMCVFCNYCIACLFRLPLHSYTVESRDTLNDFLLKLGSEVLVGKDLSFARKFAGIYFRLEGARECSCACNVGKMELSSSDTVLCGCMIFLQTLAKLYDRLFNNQVWDLSTGKPLLQLQIEQVCRHNEQSRGSLAEAGFEHTGEYSYLFGLSVLICLKNIRRQRSVGPHLTLDLIADEFRFQHLYRTKVSTAVHPTTKGIVAVTVSVKGSGKLAHFTHDSQLTVYALQMDCTELVFSPNGSFYAAEGFEKEKTLLKMFSTTSGDPIASFHLGNKGGFSFTCDSQFLVFMYAEGTIKACETATLQSFECLSYSFKQTHDGFLNWWCFSNENKEVVISYTDLASPCAMMIQQTQNHTSELLCPNGLSFTSSCTLYAIYSDSHTRTWMLKDKTLIHQTTQVSLENCLIKTACILDPSSSARVFLCTDSEVLWYDLANRIKQKTTVAVNSNNAVLAFSACGRKVLCYNEEVPYVIIYNVDCGTSVHFQTSGGIAVECGCFLPNNSDEVVLCGKFQVEIWNCTSMEIQFEIPVKIQPNYALGNFTHCAVSVDGKLLACSYIDKILIFSLETRRKVGELGCHLGQVAFCQFFRTHNILSYGVDGCVFLWDLRCMTAVGYAKVAVGNENIVALSVSPDDDIIACGLSSGRIAFIRIHNLSAARPPLLRSSNSRPRFASVGSVDPVSGSDNSVPERRQDTAKKEVFFEDDFMWEDISEMDSYDGDETSDSEPATNVEREEFDH